MSQISDALKRLPLRPGDVVLFRGQLTKAFGDEWNRHLVRNGLADPKRGISQVFLVALEPTESMDTLTDREKDNLLEFLQAHRRKGELVDAVNAQPQGSPAPPPSPSPGGQIGLGSMVPTSFPEGSAPQANVVGPNADPKTNPNRGVQNWCMAHWEPFKQGVIQGTHNGLLGNVLMMEQFLAIASHQHMQRLKAAHPDVTDEALLNHLIRETAPQCCWLGDAAMENILKRCLNREG